MRARVVFVGQSLRIFDWLLTRPDVVVCGAFIPASENPRLSEWYTRSVTREVPLIFDATPQDVERELPPGTDLGVCAHFERLPVSVLRATRLGFLNIHPAPLPDYPGRYPLIDLVLSGARQGGVSLHWMTERVDQGDLIGVERFAIAPLDGPIELEIKAEHLALRLLNDHWVALIEGYAPRTPQPPYPLKRSQRRIPCPTSAESGLELWRMLCAYAPYGGMWVLHEAKSLIVCLGAAHLSPDPDRSSESDHAGERSSRASAEASSLMIASADDQWITARSSTPLPLHHREPHRGATSDWLIKLSTTAVSVRHLDGSHSPDPPEALLSSHILRAGDRLTPLSEAQRPSLP